MPDFLAKYFTKNEMDKAIQEAQKPIESSPKNKKPQVYESDSEPSCDNFEEEEMKEIFNEALSEADIEEQFPKAVIPPKVEVSTLNVVPEEIEPPIEEEKQTENEVDDIANQINSLEDY